jgi:hypothetical protein
MVRYNEIRMSFCFLRDLSHFWFFNVVCVIVCLLLSATRKFRIRVLQQFLGAWTLSHQSQQTSLFAAEHSLDLEVRELGKNWKRKLGVNTRKQVT